MSTARDRGQWAVVYQDPRSTATPPVDAAVERFKATYRASSQQDDFDAITGILNGITLSLALCGAVGALIHLIQWAL